MSKTSKMIIKTKRGKGKGHGSKQSEWFIQALGIIVHRGDPVDAQSTRHTSFFIEYPNGRNVLSHVVGAHGFFEFEERWDTNPSESHHYERTIPVATIQTTTPMDMTVRDILYAVPVNNEERGWNCHNHIGDGLAALRKYVPVDAAVAAADQMASVLLEAPDEG